MNKEEKQISKKLRKYKKKFSENALWDKFKKQAKKAGIKAVYTALLLYYSLQNPNMPKKIKSIVYGALGYFIFPLDLIPDTIPVAGYTDDFGVLLATLVYITLFIDDDVKRKAKEKLKSWFGDIDDKEIKEVDDKINSGKE